ncbi:UNVERIFIED_CONTAM: Lysine-specific demethylase 4C [Gekko kuhli]
MVSSTVRIDLDFQLAGMADMTESSMEELEGRGEKIMAKTWFIFVASHGEDLKVEFEDGSQIATKREEIYTLDEELPKRVRARFSTASDMRFEDTFYGADIIQGEKKRQRVLSSRFKNEYVDDPSYRSFLKSSFQKKGQKRL